MAFNNCFLTNQLYLLVAKLRNYGAASDIFRIMLFNVIVRL